MRSWLLRRWGVGRGERPPEVRIEASAWAFATVRPIAAVCRAANQKILFILQRVPPPTSQPQHHADHRAIDQAVYAKLVVKI